MPEPMDLGGAIVGDHHAHGDAAGQRFGGGHDIRQYDRIGKLIGEVLARAADAALDLVENQQRIVAIGQLARLADVFHGHGEDAALALYPFDDNACGAFADNLFQRDFIVGWNEVRAGKQRLKIAAIFFLAGDGESAQRTSVERIVQRDNFEFFVADFVAVRAHHLQCAFHGLGAGVAEERALQAAGFGQPFGERALIGVEVEIGAVQHAAGLLADHLHQARVRVAQRVHADAGDEIEIALARCIKNVAAFAMIEQQRIAGVGLEQVLALERSHAVKSAAVSSATGGKALDIAFMITCPKTRVAALAL